MSDNIFESFFYHCVVLGLFNFMVTISSSVGMRTILASQTITIPDNGE